MDLTEVISGAVHEAEDSGILPEPSPSSTPDDSGSGDISGAPSESGASPSATPGEVSPSSGAAAAAASATPAPGATTDPTAPPRDELTEELESFGIHAPVVGQREGKFRWNQVRRVLENNRKKLGEQHSVALRERDAKIAAATERVRNMDAVDKLIVTDPDRYIRTLAGLHPDKYGKYVGMGATPGAAAPLAPGEKPPGPDAEFADGSRGYSPEGLDALMNWHAARVEASVTKRLDAEYTKRFGPIEREHKSRQFIEEKTPVVRGQIADARAVWGKALDEHEQAIVKVMAENDGKEGRPFLSFDACIARVLVPKTQADRNAMRADLLKEINGRPAAAARTGPAATAGGPGTGPRSLEDVIRQQIAGLR